MKDINSFSALLDIAQQSNKSIPEIFIELECSKVEISQILLRKKIKAHLSVMMAAIERGINNNTRSFSGLSGDDAYKFRKRYEKTTDTPLGSTLSKVIVYALAVMEENQRMGKIVACPTAGSCGIVPATIMAYHETFDFSEDKLVESLILAGGIGKIIAHKVPLAGAVAGCQAECGAAASMASAALTYLMGGDHSQILHAGALTLKNILGLSCDPVAGLVEVPCIKRNAFLAIQGVVGSEMALAGIVSQIPFDEVVDAMKQTGQLLSPVLKECSEGGLAVTETAKKIESLVSNVDF